MGRNCICHNYRLIKLLDDLIKANQHQLTPFPAPDTMGTHALLVSICSKNKKKMGKSAQHWVLHKDELTSRLKDISHATDVTCALHDCNCVVNWAVDMVDECFTTFTNPSAGLPLGHVMVFIHDRFTEDCVCIARPKP